MSVKINIGCGRTPTEGWRNFDNTLAIRLARSPLKYFLAKFFGLLNKTQIENSSLVNFLTQYNLLNL